MNKEKLYLDKLNYYNSTNDTYKINKYHYKLKQIGNGLFDKFIDKIKSKVKKDNKIIEKEKIEKEKIEKEKLIKEKLAYNIYLLIKNHYKIEKQDKEKSHKYEIDYTISMKIDDVIYDKKLSNTFILYNNNEENKKKIINEIYNFLLDKNIDEPFDIEHNIRYENIISSGKKKYKNIKSFIGNYKLEEIKKK